jgi:hypothetical protein
MSVVIGDVPCPYDFMCISVSLLSECPIQSHNELDPKVSSKDVSLFYNVYGRASGLKCQVLYKAFINQ